MKRKRREEHFREVGRRAVEGLIRAQERTGCKLYDMEIVGDDVIIKADYIRPVVEMCVALEATGMSHDDAVQLCVQMLKRRAEPQPVELRATP